MKLLSLSQTRFCKKRHDTEEIKKLPSDRVRVVAEPLETSRREVKLLGGDHNNTYKLFIAVTGSIEIDFDPLDAVDLDAVRLIITYKATLVVKELVWMLGSRGSTREVISEVLEIRVCALLTHSLSPDLINDLFNH